MKEVLHLVPRMSPMTGRGHRIASEEYITVPFIVNPGVGRVSSGSIIWFTRSRSCI